MLTVAAAALEGYGGNPLLRTALREAADKEAGKLKRGETRNRDFEGEEKRIAAQRNLFTFLPPGTHKDRLMQAMLQRAYDLMWDGMCTECDALTEFLPSAEVDRMFEAWDRDQSADQKSAFYEGRYGR
jgi:hypothetical protein